jgi:hypothetical protein
MKLVCKLKVHSVVVLVSTGFIYFLKWTQQRNNKKIAKQERGKRRNE